MNQHDPRRPKSAAVFGDLEVLGSLRESYDRVEESERSMVEYEGRTEEPTFQFDE